MSWYGATFWFWWSAKGAAPAFNPPIHTGPPPNAIVWRGEALTLGPNILTWR